MNDAITVTLHQVYPRRRPGQRPQPWRFIAHDAADNRPLARSIGRYTSEDEARADIVKLYGPDAAVVVKRTGTYREPSSALLAAEPPDAS